MTGGTQAALPYDRVRGKKVKREGWTGWVACPAPLGTVVPASQLPTRRAILKHAAANDDGSEGTNCEY